MSTHLHLRHCQMMPNSTLNLSVCVSISMHSRMLLLRYLNYSSSGMLRSRHPCDSLSRLIWLETWPYHRVNKVRTFTKFHILQYLYCQWPTDEAILSAWRLNSNVLADQQCSSCCLGGIIFGSLQARALADRHTIFWWCTNYRLFLWGQTSRSVWL